MGGKITFLIFSKIFFEILKDYFLAPPDAAIDVAAAVAAAVAIDAKSMFPKKIIFAEL